MPDTLVNETTQRLLSSFVRRLDERRVSLDQYFEATNQDADALVAELRTQAAEQVRADLALRALASSEVLEVTDDELAAEISRLAEESGRSVNAVARQIAEGAGLEALRSDVRNSKAVEWLLDHVEVVDEQGNPMDRALLLEHQGSPEEPAEPGDTTGVAWSTGADDSVSESHVANDALDGEAADAVDEGNDTEEGLA
jgi:trigger factor